MSRDAKGLPLFDRIPRPAPAEPVDARPEPRIFAVSELDFLLRTVVEDVSANVQVAGEVTGLRAAASGHAYFTLRDESEEAAIDCVMYRTAPMRAHRLLADGARIVLLGRATVYAPRGRLQFIAENAKPLGRGALLEALEKLKAQLAAEGLFDPEKKRPLPKDPRVIGVVTSRDGAALHDIVKVAFSRAPIHIVFARAQVQGQDAARSIARSVAMLARHPDVEVIIVGRGGGSQEDLRAFNDERLVRQIAACPVPVVSAVGHEIDVTLTDLAADVRASTPSNAAELVVPDVVGKMAMLDQFGARLMRSIGQRLGEAQQGLDDAATRMALSAGRTVSSRRSVVVDLERRLQRRHPSAIVRAARGSIDPLERRLRDALRRRVGRDRMTLVDLASRLSNLSPLAVLGRGFALVQNADGHVVVSSEQVRRGELVRVRLAAGELRARVEETMEKIDRAGDTLGETS